MGDRGARGLVVAATFHCALVDIVGYDKASLIAVIWASGRDDALGTPSPHPYYLNERKLSRSSSEKDCGCSHAAKWPPFTISL